MDEDNCTQRKGDVDNHFSRAERARSQHGQAEVSPPVGQAEELEPSGAERMAQIVKLNAGAVAEKLREYCAKP